MTWLPHSPFSSPPQNNLLDDGGGDDNDDGNGNGGCLYGTGWVVDEARTGGVDVYSEEKEDRDGNHEHDVVSAYGMTSSTPIPTPPSLPQRPIPHSFFSNRLTFRRLIVRPCVTFLVGAILFHYFSAPPQMNAQKNVFQFEFSWGNDNENESQQQQQKSQPFLRSPKYVLLPSPYNAGTTTTTTTTTSNHYSFSSTTTSTTASTQQQFAYPSVPTSWYGGSSSGMTTTIKTNNQMQVHGDDGDSDDDEDDDDSDDGSSSSSSSGNTNNVAKFGWDPTLYPNPVYQPNQCGIAYLLDRYNSNNDNDNNNDENANTTEDTTDTTTTGASSSPLRLCDPDWVLGGIYLEEIATAMQNFSRMFSTLSFPVPATSKKRRFFPFRSSTTDKATTKESDTSTITDEQRDEQSSEDSITGSYDDGEISTTSTTTAPPFEFQAQEQQQQEEPDTDGDANVMSNSPGNHNSEDIQQRQYNAPATVELAIATVRSMNVPAVLRQGSYYTYEDEDDMVNDAAQLFARYLHNRWWNTDSSGGDSDGSNSDSLSSNNNGSSNNNNHNYGILIFMSIQDRVCFISTGMAIRNILPWWRLEHVVASMKPDLRRRDYGHAILSAIDDLSAMIAAGPPTFQDRLHDFLTRFGVVIAFALFTFVFGAYGEYSDRRKRWQYAESRSKLTPVELQKARLLQKGFHTTACPICLETFDYGECDEGYMEIVEDMQQEQHRFQSCLPTSSSGHKQGEDSKEHVSAVGTTRTTNIIIINNNNNNNNNNGSGGGLGLGMKRVDSMGIPLWGFDKKRIKLLRCGHIFCESCWKGYVHSGQGNPCICPVCRQDVGKSSKAKSQQQRRREQRQQHRPQQQQTPQDTTPLLLNTTNAQPSLGASVISGRNSQPSYDSVTVALQRDNNIVGGGEEDGGNIGGGLTMNANSTASFSTRRGGGGGGLWSTIGLFDRLRFGTTSGNVPFVTTATIRRYHNDDDDDDDDDEYHDAEHRTDRMDDFLEDGENSGLDFGLTDDDDDELVEEEEEEAPREVDRLDPTPVEQITMWMAANPHAF